MNIDRAHRIMTAWIAALFVAVQVLVSFPASHDHHDHVPECECAHGVGHFHASEPHSDHSECSACQLLGNLGFVEQGTEIPAEYKYVVVVPVCQFVSFLQDRSESARAPPAEMM